MTYLKTITSNQTIVMAAMACITPVLHTSCDTNQDKSVSRKPNIVIILADDMGYGDVASLNPHAWTLTPAIDRMVNEGITFTKSKKSL